MLDKDGREWHGLGIGTWMGDESREWTGRAKECSKEQSNSRRAEGRRRRQQNSNFWLSFFYGIEGKLVENEQTQKRAKEGRKLTARHKKMNNQIVLFVSL